MFGDSLPMAACYIGYSSAFGANMGYQWTYNIGHVCIVCPFHFFCGHATFDPLPKIKRITQIDQCLTHTPRLLWLEIGDEGLEQSYPCVNWSKHILISPISSCIPMITGVSTCPTWTSPNKTGDIVSVSNRYFSSDVKQISKTSKTRHGNQPLFDYLFIIYMCIYI